MGGEADPLAELLRRWARHTTAPAPARRPRHGPVPGLLVAVALLGVVALAVARPVTAPAPAPAPAEAPVASAPSAPPPLGAPGRLPAGASSPLDGVRAQVDGVGDARVGEGQLEVDWAVGALDLEVEAGRGLRVQVRTDEATVRVVGTGFGVRRSALGTEVTVRHGVVEVACGGAAAVRLGAGASQLCLPVAPAGFLGRARALEEAGAPAVEVRAAAEAGLVGELPGSVRSELEVVRIRSFLAEHDDAQALAAAEAYLGAGYPDRRREVLEVGAGLAEAAGRCDEARRWRAELGAGPGSCGP